MRNAPIIRWICCVGIVTFLTNATNLRADDNPATPGSDGYKMVPVANANGGRTTIRVKNQLDPYRNVRSTGSSDKYEPSAIDFGRTSSLANKSFSSSENPLAQKSSSLIDASQRTFITKSYFDDVPSEKSSSTPNLNTKVFTSANMTYGKGASGFDKNYPVSKADETENKAALFAANSSDYQNRTANLGTQKAETYGSNLGNKTYLGPEGKIERDDINEVNDGLMHLKDLPSRPLTIDEVRALINHGVAPDTDAKPEPPSKPLNDPDYQPDRSPAPPPQSSTEDSADDVPSPGTMATHPQVTPPENSEPLPNK